MHRFSWIFFHGILHWCGCVLVEHGRLLQHPLAIHLQLHLRELPRIV